MLHVYVSLLVAHRIVMFASAGRRSSWHNNTATNCIADHKHNGNPVMLCCGGVRLTGVRERGGGAGHAPVAATVSCHQGQQHSSSPGHTARRPVQHSIAVFSSELCNGWGELGYYCGLNTSNIDVLAVSGGATLPQSGDIAGVGRPASQQQHHWKREGEV